MRLNVFLNAYGKRNFVGVLEEQNKRIFFEYAPEFLRLNIPFSPFMLPLKQQVYEDEKYTFERIMLISAVKITIENALNLIGVSSPEKM